MWKKEEKNPLIITSENTLRQATKQSISEVSSGFQMRRAPICLLSIAQDSALRFKKKSHYLFFSFVDIPRFRVLFKSVLI